ncbi:unnamed protein product [Protopolystoma xenopodis]|uniref:Uncharacterized protein n=1 Tax=Protopolystoma xenopodis TaxID=117903 RepID=A0A3S5C6R4_9PLAT|nr:unnamed protein product [Protopolystoma xenopodis]
MASLAAAAMAEMTNASGPPGQPRLPPLPPAHHQHHTTQQPTPLPLVTPGRSLLSGTTSVPPLSHSSSSSIPNSARTITGSAGVSLPGYPSNLPLISSTALGGITGSNQSHLASSLSLPSSSGTPVISSTVSSASSHFPGFISASPLQPPLSLSSSSMSQLPGLPSVLSGFDLTPHSLTSGSTSSSGNISFLPANSSCNSAINARDPSYANALGMALAAAGARAAAVASGFMNPQGSSSTSSMPSFSSASSSIPPSSMASSVLPAGGSTIVNCHVSGTAPTASTTNTNAHGHSGLQLHPHHSHVHSLSSLRSASPHAHPPPPASPLPPFHSFPHHQHHHSPSAQSQHNHHQTSLFVAPSHHPAYPSGPASSCIGGLPVSSLASSLSSSLSGSSFSSGPPIQTSATGSAGLDAYAATAVAEYLRRLGGGNNSLPGNNSAHRVHQVHQSQQQQQPQQIQQALAAFMQAAAAASAATASSNASSPGSGVCRSSTAGQAGSSPANRASAPLGFQTPLGLPPSSTNSSANRSLR